MNHDQFTKLDTQFTKLFKLVANLRTEVHTGFERMASKDELNRVYDLLDKNIAEHQRQEEKRVVMVAELNRHERWIGQVAEKSRTRLTRD
jgi:hypothetical protein